MFGFITSAKNFLRNRLFSWAELSFGESTFKLLITPVVHLLLSYVARGAGRRRLLERLHDCTHCELVQHYFVPPNRFRALSALMGAFIGSVAGALGGYRRIRYKQADSDRDEYREGRRLGLYCLAVTGEPEPEAVALAVELINKQSGKFEPSRNGISASRIYATLQSAKAEVEGN